MSAIQMKNIVKEYGDGHKAVNDVSIDVADGEFVILVGPSGCGKSTLLRMIVGLEDITEGDMIIGDERVNDKDPRERNLAMVFQNYALYPHLTVYENIAFPLRLNKEISDADLDERAEQVDDFVVNAGRMMHDQQRRIVAHQRNDPAAMLGAPGIWRDGLLDDVQQALHAGHGSCGVRRRLRARRAKGIAARRRWRVGKVADIVNPHQFSMCGAFARRNQQYLIGHDERRTRRQLRQQKPQRRAK